MIDATWWRASARGKDVTIQAVDVVRSTVAFVFVRRADGTEIRHEIRKPNELYAPTWSEARQFLVDRADAAVVEASKSLEHLKSIVTKSKGLQRPKP